MLFQRMIADEKIGLNYDYMGYAEFEFGATTQARAGLAEAMLDNNLTAKRVHFLGYVHKNKVEDFKAILVCRKEDLKDKDTFEVSIEKTGMRTENKDILAWMTVRPYIPLIILRDDSNYPAYIDRLEKYLKPFADQIQEERNRIANVAGA